MALGIAQGAFEKALKYAKETIQFEKPLIESQAIQFKLADMATQIEAARHLIYHAAFLEDRGQKYVKESAMAKLFASEIGRFVTYEAIQIFGEYGYSRRYPVERYLRDVKLCEIGEGTSEIQRLVIFRELIK
jgi:alkylation response protein AidB-like acyl-CoA dehydrogenase